MNRKDTHAFFAGLLESEDAQKRLKEMFDDVTTKRVVTAYVECDLCNYLNRNPARKARQKIEKYDIKQAATFLRLMADFGPGKPVEKKEVAVNSTVRMEDLSGLTDDELSALVG